MGKHEESIEYMLLYARENHVRLRGLSYKYVSEIELYLVMSRSFGLGNANNKMNNGIGLNT